MFDATEVFTKCPKGCDARLVLCLPGLFGCPKCKSVFISAKNRYGTMLRKTSKENRKKCLEVLVSKKWKKVKTIKPIEPKPSSSYGKVVELPKATDVFKTFDKILEAFQEAKEALQILIIHVSYYSNKIDRSFTDLRNKFNSLIKEDK